uniref:Secreted protein n=1 Tax=Panagrellus redivivus TaxID=6233 RepID=A0A7E4ZVQ9_PANRE
MSTRSLPKYLPQFVIVILISQKVVAATPTIFNDFQTSSKTDAFCLVFLSLDFDNYDPMTVGRSVACRSTDSE